MTRYTPQWLQAGSYSGAQDRRLISALWPGPASTGCAVTASAGTMSVLIASGQVAVPTQNQSGSTLCSSDAVETVGPLNQAPASGTNRIDLIICRPRGNDLDGGANTDFIFDFVTGTPAATPAVPATPAGTVALAQISIPGGSASIAAGNITDVRPGGLNIPPSSGLGAAALGYVTGGQSATTVSVGATATTIMTASWQAVAGRRYRVEFLYNGNQATATGQVSIGAPTGANPFVVRAGLAAGQNTTGQGWVMVQATSTGTMTLTCGASTSAGSCSFASSWNQWVVFDEGAAP
jgi:hypothetical protein